MEITAANSFIEKVNKEEYLKKLIPDLSVFDIAERYFIEKNSTGVDKLFFYNPNDNTVINFRRFIIKTSISGLEKFILTNNNNNNSNVSSDNRIIYHGFSVGDEHYHIIIDEQNKSGGFKIGTHPTNENYIIGVCF